MRASADEGAASRRQCIGRVCMRALAAASASRAMCWQHGMRTEALGNAIAS